MADMPRQRTPAQQDASRRNGARSRGPKTAAGKAKSARNALRHGLRARQSVSADEVPAWVLDLDAKLETMGHIGLRRRELLDELGFIALLEEKTERLIQTAGMEFAAMIGTAPDTLNNAAAGAAPDMKAISASFGKLRKLLSYRTRFSRQRNACLRWIATSSELKL